MFQIIKNLFIDTLTFIRELKINPNKYSRIKVEEFTLQMSCEITLGDKSQILLVGMPDTIIRPQIGTTNVLWPQFILLTEIKAANVSTFVGTGKEDAYNYSAINALRKVDLPTLTPANRISVRGEYTGMIPEGYHQGDKFTFTMSFTGPAKLCE